MKREIHLNHLILFLGAIKVNEPVLFRSTTESVIYYNDTITLECLVRMERSKYYDRSYDETNVTGKIKFYKNKV